MKSRVWISVFVWLERIVSNGHHASNIIYLFKHRFSQWSMLKIAKAPIFQTAGKSLRTRQYWYFTRRRKEWRHINIGVLLNNSWHADSSIFNVQRKPTAMAFALLTSKLLRDSLPCIYGKNPCTRATLIHTLTSKVEAVVESTQEISAAA